MRELIHPIVIGYDGSADSERAVDWAVSAAKIRHCPIRLVAVIEDGAPPDWLPERVETARQRAVKQLAAAGEPSSGLPVTVVKPRREAVTHALLRLASDAQLIVLGARGHSAFSGFLIGSVSQHLSRHDECPVVVVREPHDPNMRRIVVGYDDSPGSRRAVEFAFEMASATEAPLAVIHGWRHSTAGPVGMYLPMSNDIAEEIDSERHALREATSEWRDKYPDVDVTLEAIPLHPTRVLTDASEHAAQVVVGSRGRGAFTGMLLGSVSQGLLHHAHCTVAIAR